MRKSTSRVRIRQQHIGVLSDDMWSVHGRENWRPVGRFEGKYEVSSMGRVRVTATGQIRALQESRDHLRVSLYLRGRQTVWVHQLVAEAFIGPRPDGQEVRHLDGNGLNNRLENLAYGSHQENMLDRRAHGTAINAHTDQESCKRGHVLDGANVYFNGSARKRSCKTCARLRERWKKTGEWDFARKCHISEM
jgi:hypothetical protein